MEITGKDGYFYIYGLHGLQMMGMKFDWSLAFIN